MSEIRGQREIDSQTGLVDAVPFVTVKTELSVKVKLLISGQFMSRTLDRDQNGKIVDASSRNPLFMKGDWAFP